MILSFDFTGGFSTGNHGYAPFPHICNLHLHRYIILYTNSHPRIANTCSNEYAILHIDRRPIS
ncbi:hypothetical protein BDQ17DRAFT_1376333 [Cyathus striatus]|nr:hypothetical protein BDQ17DRAFT_1376333 [Cyathus striatus]